MGGVANAFVKLANEQLQGVGVEFQLHVSGDIDPMDESDVEPPIVSVGDFGTLHDAVAMGALDVALDIAINNGHEFGELFVAGLPFGMAPEEYMTWLYEGGGLALQQELYDDRFDNNVVVIPVGITTAQGPGWFPEPLPDPDSPGERRARIKTQFDPPDTKDRLAMRELCETPMIVRWAEPGAAVWRKVCELVGVDVERLNPGTRCEGAFEPCPSEDNPQVVFPEKLIFGGFAPGVLPQQILNTGNTDALEFNLPTAHIQFSKRALGIKGTLNAEADISELIAKAPLSIQQIMAPDTVVHRAAGESAVLELRAHGGAAQSDPCRSEKCGPVQLHRPAQSAG